jgi:hypothetical protein
VPSAQPASRSKPVIRVHLRSSAAKDSCLARQPGRPRPPPGHTSSRIAATGPRPSASPSKTRAATPATRAQSIAAPEPRFLSNPLPPRPTHSPADHPRSTVPPPIAKRIPRAATPYTPRTARGAPPRRPAPAARPPAGPRPRCTHASVRCTAPVATGHPPPPRSHRRQPRHSPMHQSASPPRAPLPQPHPPPHRGSPDTTPCTSPRRRMDAAAPTASPAVPRAPQTPSPPAGRSAPRPPRAFRGGPRYIPPSRGPPRPPTTPQPPHT